uniref:Uncharacterized protein n=1 Tax=Triticum urartu TaxID=4572 RepID=A0A8R7R2I8_TRIUA
HRSLATYKCSATPLLTLVASHPHSPLFLSVSFARARSPTRHRRSRSHQPPLVAPRHPRASPSLSPSPMCSKLSRDSPYARHRAHLHRVYHRRSSSLPRLRSTSGRPDLSRELAVSSTVDSPLPFFILAT